MQNEEKNVENIKAMMQRSRGMWGIMQPTGYTAMVRWDEALTEYAWAPLGAL